MKAGRELIHTGTVHRVENFKTNKTEVREIHLFNDSFLITKNRGESAEGPFKYKSFIVPMFTSQIEMDPECTYLPLLALGTLLIR